MKLTERQRILLTEAERYAISEHGSEYYRLGGFGVVPLRYDHRSYRRLEQLGLVERPQGYWKTTPAGRAALQNATDGGADAT